MEAHTQGDFEDGNNNGNNNANSTDYYAKYIGEIKETMKQIGIQNFDCENKPFEELIKLKKLGSATNNFLTMKLSLYFCDWLEEKKIINNTEKIEKIREIKERSSNSSGYDIEHYTKNGTKLKFLAEVKCMVPVKDNEFDSNQKNSIMNDIYNLVNGKNELKGKTCGYYKFLVLYNDKEGKTKNAITKLLENRSNEAIIIDINEEKTKKEEWKTDPVYTVLLNPDIQKKENVTIIIINEEKTKKEEWKTDPVYIVLLNPDRPKLKLLKLYINSLNIVLNFLFLLLLSPAALLSLLEENIRKPGS